MTFFDPATTEIVENSFEALPNGCYRVITVDPAYKTTKKGDGKFATVTLQVADGPYVNRKVFSNFNIHNPSEMAQKIGRSDFKKFLMACGITRRLESETDFLNVVSNKVLYVTLGQKKDKDGVMQNEVKEFSALPKGSSPVTGQIARGPDPQVPF